MSFTFGADPEVFVRKNGVAISAHGLVHGTKESPQKTNNGAVQVDGMALEFNIDPTPMVDFEGFNTVITRTIRDLRELVPGVNLVIDPVMEFDEACLASQPKEALELGCDPDYNAYTLLPNPRPDGSRNFRTGAGHVHIGWGADIPVDNEEHMEICSSFIKMLDATTGLYMTYIDRDPRRRELYGCAGAFRPKSYGVEYRTPSNVWIRNRARRKMMHTTMRLAISRMTSGYSVQQTAGQTEERIQDIINTGDYEAAYAILNDYYGYHGSKTWESVKLDVLASETKVKAA